MPFVSRGTHLCLSGGFVLLFYVSVVSVLCWKPKPKPKRLGSFATATLGLPSPMSLVGVHREARFDPLASVVSLAFLQYIVLGKFACENFQESQLLTFTEHRTIDCCLRLQPGHLGPLLPLSNLPTPSLPTNNPFSAPRSAQGLLQPRCSGIFPGRLKKPYGMLVIEPGQLCAK